MNESVILDLYRNPKFFKEQIEHTHQGTAVNDHCGDEITVSIKVENGKVADICFCGNACSICLASGELLCREILNKQLSEVKTLDQKYFFQVLDVNDTSKRFSCAMLPFDALKKFL
jgi:nitrogen fixation NifU-like protein